MELALLPHTKIGVYEKALPQVSWAEKFKIAAAAGFDFIEMSIDESDQRLKRLTWTEEQIHEINQLQATNTIFLKSIALSGNRRFPLGSLDPQTRAQGLLMLKQAIILASKLNIRIIQLAGYDVYYEPKSQATHDTFIEQLKIGMVYAQRYGVMLAIETMDDPFVKSVEDFLAIKAIVKSPWFQIYPDIGNLSAWHGSATKAQIIKAIPYASIMHVKDTIAITATAPGVFKKVAFGEGCVQFRELFKTLRDHNYQGALVMEAWFEDYEHPLQELKQAVNFLEAQGQKKWPIIKN